MTFKPCLCPDCGAQGQFMHQNLFINQLKEEISCLKNQIKLVVVIGALAYGLFGLMKHLGSDEEETNDAHESI